VTAAVPSIGIPPPSSPGTAAVIRTVCCYCGVGCGITVARDVRGNLSLSGDSEHPTNRGMLCSKGKTLLHAAAARAGRLVKPQLRLDRDQPFADTTWDHALGHVAAAFKRIIAEHGPDAVAFYCSGQMLTEEYYVVNKLVKGFIGTNNLDTNSRLCMSSAVAGYKQTLGSDSPPIAYADIESCDTFLVAGANPAWAHPIIWRRVEARRAGDPTVRIIVVDPRRTASCASADLHLQIRPGTDVVLHLGLARQLIAIGGVDHAFIAAHTHGWEALQAACAEFTLERTAAICGLDAKDIATAASWLVGDRRFLSMWTMGLNQSAVGVDKNTSLINLSLITGKIGRPGCGPFSLTGQPNAMGGREVGGMANLASAHRDLANPVDRAEIAAHWGVDRVPEKPGLTAVELFRALKAGTVKAVWIIATNPVESLPDSAEIEAALKHAELVVVQDIDRTATADCANVVLPAATWLEKTGTMTNSERRITLLTPLVAPPGDCLPDSRIICRFAAIMGWQHAFSYADEAAIFAEHAALTRGRDCDISGLSHQRLRDGSFQWPVPHGEHPGTPRLFGENPCDSDGRRFPTADGRARLKSPAFISRSEEPDAEFPLILTTGRLRDQWHTMTRTGKVAKLRDHAPAPFCEIHPHDAAARGISQDDIVVVHGRRGEVQVRAELTDAVRRGVVFLPMHWGKKLGGERGRTNNLTSSRYDPVSQEPDLKFAAVEIDRHQPPARRIIIIGGGAAARAFVEAHLKHRLDDTITIFGEEAQPIYNRVLLPHMIGGHQDFASMVTATKEGLAAQGVTFRPGERIAKIDPPTRTVVDAEGTRHSYDVLIIATGSRPARHYQGPMPRAGVHTLRNRSDAERIQAQAGPGRTAVIVGGGVLGLELADALNQLGTAVTVVQRSDRLMGRQIDVAAAAMLAQMIQAKGITVKFRADVETLSGDERVTGMTLKDGSVLKADLVIFATGTAPNAELARAAVIACSTGITVDRHLRSSDPHIFAMGEVAEMDGMSAGTTAASAQQAFHLSEYLRGNLHAPCPPPLNATVLKVDGIQLSAVGVVDEAPGMSVVSFADHNAGIYQKCVIKDDRVVGVVMVGDTTAFAEHRDLVASGVELEDRRRTLLRSSGAGTSVEGRLVCSCNQIGEATISRVISEKTAKGTCDLGSVCASTRAGTSCGSCRPEVQKLISSRMASATTPQPARV
jgi:ferredoxin-nitrate reductase